MQQLQQLILDSNSDSAQDQFTGFFGPLPGSWALTRQCLQLVSLPANSISSSIPSGNVHAHSSKDSLHSFQS